MISEGLPFIVLGSGFLVLGLVLIPLVRHFRKDQIFTGIPPGLAPAPGQRITTTRVSGRRQYYTGPVAVRFTPPEGVGPGLVGTVVDGQAHLRDVTALIVGLAVRGHLRIVEATPSSGSSKRGQKVRKKDWELISNPYPPADQLSPPEQKFMSDTFANRSVVRLSHLTSHFAHDLRETQVALYREVVDRGWYKKHPRKRGCRLRSLACVIILLGLVLLLGVLASDTSPLVEAALPIGFTGFGVILFALGSGRAPRTALGTAQRIQALGFRDYLATAEAEQIRFEEAAEIFSRYLPYAIVFGLAKEWAKVFQSVVNRAKVSGASDVVFDLTWFDGVYLAFEAGSAVLELGSLAGDLIDLGDAVGSLGEGLSHFADGVGGFVDAGGLLSDVGDACADLDGCDIGCIDF